METENILGFIRGDNNDIPFCYKNGRLILMHSSIESWKEEKNRFYSFFDSDGDEEWIGEKYFDGICQDESKIRFCVSELASQDNGYYEYDVKFFVKFRGMEHDKINVIELKGREIDYFLDVGTVNKFISDEKSIGTTIERSEPFKLCSYTFEKTDVIVVAFYGCEIRQRSQVPLKKTSGLRIELSKMQDEEFVLNICHHFMNLFQYLSFRRNVEISGVKIFNYGESKKKPHGYGTIHRELELTGCVDDDKEIRDKMIKYRYVKEGMDKLLELISKDKIYLEHIVLSLETRNSYRPDRIIMIFAAFEREFNDIYGVDCERSQEYTSVKAEVVEMLLKKADCFNGKKKKYYKSIAKSVDKLDNSYGKRIEIAIKDCYEELKVMIAHYYKNDMENKALGIGARMNAVRNNMVHANMGWELKPINIADLDVLQDLIYAMRLKQIGINTEAVRGGLAQLRGFTI